MKNRLLLLIALLCLSSIAYSQLGKPSVSVISGTVVDTLQNETIEMATATLYSLRDSSIVQASMANKDGFFELKNVKPASYFLVVTFIGYKPTYINLPEHRFTSSTLKLGNINLDNSGITLSAIEITAEPPELVVKEDTLEYNAAAFKLQESAVVEDLIKRLPGVEVDTEGKITTSTGKQVRRVFVDGKEFFGNDPKMATKNLTVDIVDKVQVVEKKSDLAILTGVEDDDPETIINITIKKGMKKGWMGNATGGVGALVDNSLSESARYTTNAMINRFTEENQLSFIANANNINNQASSDAGNTVRSSRGGSAGNGITSSNTFGVNTANILSKKLKMGSSMTYNYSDNYTNSNSFRQNLNEKNPTDRDSRSRDQNYSNNFSFNAKLEYRPDTLTTMIFTPTISYNWSSSNSNSSQTTRKRDADSTSVNSSKSDNTLKSDGINARMQFDVSRKFSTKGRRVSFSAWFNINNSSGDGTNNSENKFYLKPSEDKSFNQESHTTGNRNSYNVRFTYVEPVYKGNFINFSYNLQVNNTENRKTTYDYDPLTDDFTLLNGDYSRSSDIQTINHNFRVNFNSNKTKYAYNIGLNIVPVYTKSKSFVKDYYGEGNDSIISPEKSRTAVNFAPQIDFTYRLSNDKAARKNLRFRYSGRTTQPSVTQLESSKNNTNPLNIRSGNPDLLPSFSNNVSFEYNDYNRNSQRSLNGSVTFTFIQNAFVNFTTYDPETEIRETKPINENGSWNSSANLLFTKPLDSKKRFKFSTQSNFGFRKQMGYTTLDKESGSVKNISKTVNLGETLGLSYSNDWFYGQLRGTIRYSETKYSLDEVERQESYNYKLSYNTQITLPYNWSIGSDINYSGSEGLTAGYNRSEVIWNAEISKQIFKKKNGSLRLQMTDILQQKLNINRSVSSTFIQDTEYTALTSYVMLSFTYRFNNIGGKRSGRGSFDTQENHYPSDWLQSRGSRSGSSRR